jgi:hypothetical protein
MAQAHSTHKDTHEQLAAHMIRPVTTPREHTESKPATTNYLLAAGSSMHYTPKVPKNNCQFQNKSMLSWETALCVLLPRAGFVVEARREASSALLQCPPSTGAMRPARQGTNISEHTGATSLQTAHSCGSNT